MSLLASQADQLQSMLAAALDHDTIALEDNAKGHISSRQTSRLLRRSLGYAVLALLIFTPNLVCALAIWSETFSALDPASLDWWGSLACGTLFAILAVVFTAWWTRESVYIFLDLREGRAAYVEGHLRRSVSQIRGSMNYFLEVQDHLFKVPKAVHDLLPDGGNLLVYFAPRSAVVLSIRPLDK